MIRDTQLEDITRDPQAHVMTLSRDEAHSVADVLFLKALYLRYAADAMQARTAGDVTLATTLEQIANGHLARIDTLVSYA